MKYLYIILGLLLIGGGYFAFTQYYSMGGQGESLGTPNSDSHLMPDGSIMLNKEAEVMQQPNQNDVQSVIVPKDAVKKPSVTLDPTARVFTVKGVNYGYDVQEIVVKEGDTVTINFESTDGYHDIVINEFGVASTRVQPGVKTSVTFVADKKGTFEYYCSVGSHRTSGMVGTFIVE